MSGFSRRRSRLHFPVTISVVLMVLNIVLMVCWIVLLSYRANFSMLTIGTILFVLILIGLTVYLLFSIKEVRLNQRQANFVDSVTHELRSPIASLRLYLETLQMRDVDVAQRQEFYRMMSEDIRRLDHLINQLLEVSRLDELGSQEDPEEVDLEPLLRDCAIAVVSRYKLSLDEVFTFQIEPIKVQVRKLLLQMVIDNLFDNAIKYSKPDPKINVTVTGRGPNRAIIHITDNGQGVPVHLRSKIFQLFFRNENELERRTSGTGLGLFIVKTLVGNMKGKVSVHGNKGQPGSTFEVELPALGKTKSNAEQNS